MLTRIAVYSRVPIRLDAPLGIVEARGTPSAHAEPYARANYDSRDDVIPRRTSCAIDDVTRFKCGSRGVGKRDVTHAVAQTVRDPFATRPARPDESGRIRVWSGGAPRVWRGEER